MPTAVVPLRCSMVPFVLIRTLARTFPRGQIFYVDSAADLIILASPRGDVPLDLAAWSEA